MKNEKTRIPSKCSKPTPPVAYTYFGQFIVHDLTFDKTPLLQNPAPDPADTLNYRSPFLDLDSVYGRGPFSKDSSLYEGIYLKLGDAMRNGERFDIPLCSSGEPLLIDSRNNENVIVRQIHAMFLKLHNMAVRELDGSAPPQEVFERARKKVQWQYQSLVHDDYLQTVCNYAVYENIVDKNDQVIDWGNCFSIPVEFAHAVARFGHSMVRNEYDLNSSRRDVNAAKVEQLFELAHRRSPLDPTWAVDWYRFTRNANGANSIDTTVVPALFHLPPESTKLFVKQPSSDEPRLPVRTLFRGVMMDLPTGEAVRDAFGASSLPQPSCTNSEYDPSKTLRELGLKATPLWYYILLEAELTERGGNLGPLGTRIMTEVIEGSLRADPASYLNRQKDDSSYPPVWKLGSVQKRINDLYDLAIVVGLGDRH